MLARVLDLFSGISAPSVAWHPLGWETLAFAEIEQFPAAVLEHHYPDVPNLGDVSKHAEWPDYEPDVIVGGSPCQAFSVAGLRKGLDDPRGNLTLTYLAVVEQYRPSWVVWENVPGVLSIDGGRTFGAFLGGLAQLGYGFAYRVLDAQYAGVPQRRRRVFVVGHSDWRRAAAVLFERHSLSGHPAPSREAWKIAPTIPSRSTAGGGLGTDFDCDGGAIAIQERAVCENPNAGPDGAGFSKGVAYTLEARSQVQAVAHTLRAEHDASVARCVTTGEGKRQDYETTTLVAQTLRGEGFDASEDGTGRGAPLVAATVAANSGRNQIEQTYVPMAFHPTQDPISGEVCHSLGANVNATAAVAFDLRGRDGSGGSSRSYVAAQQVRRLTPTECERLQGFHDNYTAIPWRGKPADQCPDGPRYKALGNSMAVPVVRWIGERIQQVEELWK